MSHMRLEQRWEIGEPGAVYEFEIKLQKITGVDMTNDELMSEAQLSLQIFADELKRRYKWIGDIYQTGRSGGWLAIEDKTGGATKAKVKTIIGLVDKAQVDFVKYLQSEYPA